MSVSFYAQMSDDVAHTWACLCGEWRGEVYPNRKSAWNAGAPKNGCSDEMCLMYSPTTHLTPLVDEPEVNLANHNASEVLDFLGIELGEDFSERCVGSLPANDFKGRVLLALGLVPPDEGLPQHETTSELFGGIRVINAGRPVGYYQDRLEGLLKVADFALENNREAVVWG